MLCIRRLCRRMLVSGVRSCTVVCVCAFHPLHIVGMLVLVVPQTCGAYVVSGLESTEVFVSPLRFAPGCDADGVLVCLPVDVVALVW